MRFRIVFFIFHLSFFLFHWAACKEKTTAPPTENTPDTTSHDFTWRIDTLGTYGSVLYDVAAINENDIWAVGEIHTNETDRFDSLGNWVNPYNAAHWNGNDWELKRIYFYLCPNSASPTPYPIRSIYAFAENNIWFTRGASFSHWNGNVFFHDCSMNSLIDGSITKIWGYNSNKLYAIGASGTFIYYNGSVWQKLESGTTIDLLDVYGSPDGSVVWACGYTDFVGTVLLKITGTTVETVYEDNDNWFNIRQDSLSGVLTSVWTDSPDKLFLISPSGLYETNASTQGQAQRLRMNNSDFPGFPHRLRGSAQNDLTIVGDFSMISHYNGCTWRYFSELEGRVSFQSVSIFNDTVIAAGVYYTNLSGLAIIARGTRQ
jgi:hypothetical protein